MSRASLEVQPGRPDLVPHLMPYVRCPAHPAVAVGPPVVLDDPGCHLPSEVSKQN